MDARVSRLHPHSTTDLPLQGLYLAHCLRERASAQRPFIYSNFVVSLDGRIATPSPKSQRMRPPPEIAHPHDWRLYLELAAQADAVITSGRRLRELGDSDGELVCVRETAVGDLGAWRGAHGLPPHPACIVLTESLELPLAALRERTQSDILIVTGARPAAQDLAAVKNARIDLVTTAAPRVSGDDILRVARERGFKTLYAIGGPEVLYTLVAAGLLDRLYLTLALKLLAGETFNTLLRGPALQPPLGFDLHEIYLDMPLLFTSFNRREDAAARTTS